MATSGDINGAIEDVESPAADATTPPVELAEVAIHLGALGYVPTNLAPVGAGHWSVCFGFVAAGRPLVIRYGHHREDFDLDRAANRFDRPGLPIPEVLDIGRAFSDRDLGGDRSGCWYAISERVDGSPLEKINAERWDRLVPSIVTSLEAMRTATLPHGVGWGSWTSIDDDGTPIGSHRTWRDYLLAIVDEPNDGRIAGWKDNLAGNKARSADFSWGLDLLDDLVDDSLSAAVVKGVTHQDMLNRNVNVIDDQISGLFDWGCAAYADHLYEFSLFEFWNPWHPELDIGRLRAELEAAWARSGYTPERVEERLRVCHLHNGLVHLMYGAYLQNWDTLIRTASRMRTLGGLG